MNPTRWLPITVIAIIRDTISPNPRARRLATVSWPVIKHSTLSENVERFTIDIWNSSKGIERFCKLLFLVHVSGNPTRSTIRGRTGVYHGIRLQLPEL